MNYNDKSDYKEVYTDDHSKDNSHNNHNTYHSQIHEKTQHDFHHDIMFLRVLFNYNHLPANKHNGSQCCLMLF